MGWEYRTSPSRGNSQAPAPVYLDRTLAETPEIVFSGGTLSDGVRMGNTDFVYVVKPRICSFAESGELVKKAILQDLLTPDEGGGK